MKCTNDKFHHMFLVHVYYASVSNFVYNEGPFCLSFVLFGDPDTKFWIYFKSLLRVLRHGWKKFLSTQGQKADLLTGCVLYGYICSHLILKGSVKISKADVTFMSSLDKYW